MQGNPDLANRIFLMNAMRFPDQWPVNVGMACAYATSGDNKQAIVYAKEALAQAAGPATGLLLSPAQRTSCGRVPAPECAGRRRETGVTRRSSAREFIPPQWQR